MKAALLLIWLCTTILVEGALIALMWKWFVAPFNAPTINLAHAVGLSVFVNLFTANPTSYKEHVVDLRRSTALRVALWIVLLVVGVVAHAAM
jgi:hypothetical protein